MIMNERASSLYESNKYFETEPARDALLNTDGLFFRDKHQPNRSPSNLFDVSPFCFWLYEAQYK